MVTEKRFDLTHIELMLKTWRGDSITWSSYQETILELGLKESDIKHNWIQEPDGLWPIFHIENIAEKMLKHHPDHCISRYMKCIWCHTENGKRSVVFIEPSDHLKRTLDDRNRTMMEREMHHNKFLDPLLEVIEEINEIFLKEFPLYARLSGPNFIAFLKENKVSPYLFFHSYFDSKGEYSTILNKKLVGGLPWKFDIRVERAEESVFIKAKNVTERSNIIIFSYP